MYQGNGLLGTNILLFAILLSMCSSGMELVILAIGVLGVCISFVQTKSK